MSSYVAWRVEKKLNRISDSNSAVAVNIESIGLPLKPIFRNFFPRHWIFRGIFLEICRENNYFSKLFPAENSHLPQHF
jgi:argonaute-like protein implicated in RNA metabolism and viral defense